MTEPAIYHAAPDHAIRLRGRWELIVSAENAVTSEREAIFVEGPGDLPFSLSQVAGKRLCYRRRFHRPTGVEPSDSLRLAIFGLNAACEVACNGRRLTASAVEGGQASYEIAPLLAFENTVEVFLTSVASREASDVGSTGPWPPPEVDHRPEARLEIRHRR